MKNDLRTTIAASGALWVLLVSSMASAGELAWSVRLVQGARPQVEVTVDTAGLASNEVVDSANFDADFRGGSNQLLGKKNFAVVDAKLFVLEAGQVYRRFYYAPYVNTQKLVAGNLTFVRRVLGGKADGEADIIQPPASTPCCKPASGTPTVQVEAPPSAFVQALKSQVQPGTSAKQLAVVVNASRASRCAAYSRRAVAQNRLNRRRQCFTADNRWSSDFEHHRRYCMDPNVDPEVVRRESVERDRLLAGCKKK